LLTAFAGALAAGADWAQGYYSVRNPDVSWRTRLMTYAFSLYNGVWPLGQDRLGLSCALKGNGMCFSAAGLARFPWRAYGLVEDAEFGLMLRIAGERVRFLRGARVFGEMVSRGEASASQRKRWEAGRRSLRGKFLGPLLRSRSIGLYRKAMYVIDLLSPTLVSLTAALILLAVVDALLATNSLGAPGAAQLRPVHLGMGVTLIIYILSPVVAVGLPRRYLLALVAAPYYAAWKVLRIAGRSPEAWVRTRREG
jgi:cellulose synthase/poly-beta-1,6-N-acetylglucosamine synthase-like glycosyltransferase